MNRPYEFTGPYAGCYANRAMCVDDRHVYLMHEILRWWGFNSALEIGSYDGASATAFIEAAKYRERLTLTFCDVQCSDSLRTVLTSAAYRGGYSSMPSWDVLASPIAFDFIFVDGNHDMESVSRELVHLVRRKPLCIMAHDTNASATGYPKAEGAEFLKRTFHSMPEYQCIEDCAEREGEETHRGMFLATTNIELFDIARRAFAKWCPVEVLA